MESFRVWCENGDFIGETDNRPDAWTLLEETRVQHVAETGCDGVDCGVNHPHGFFFDVVDGDYVVEHGQS
jgi:hypothetical protein